MMRPSANASSGVTATACSIATGGDAQLMFMLAFMLVSRASHACEFFMLVRHVMFFITVPDGTDGHSKSSLYLGFL